MSEETTKESSKRPEEKKPKSKKDANKVKKWAQERRQRIGDAFEILYKQLQNYEPSAKMSHIEILQQATSQLKELNEKVKKMLIPDEAKDEKDNLMKKLESRVRKLLVRNEQLSNLLKDAGITIPSEYGSVKKFKSRYKWSGKISMEQANVIQKKVLENKKEEDSSSKTGKPKKRKLKSTSPTCIAPKHRKMSINSNNGDVKKNLKRKKFGKIQTKMVILPQASNFNQPCLILSNPLGNKPTSTSTVIRNAPFLTTPLISSTVKPPLITRNPNITNLGPGTLILANGTIVPVLPQPQTIIPTFQNNTILVISTKPTEKPKDTVVSTVAEAKPVKKLPLLLKKACLTKTTQVNKVPIPALTSKYSNYLVCRQQISTNTVNKDKPIKDKKKTLKHTDSKNKNASESTTVTVTANVTEKSSEANTQNCNKKPNNSDNKDKDSTIDTSKQHKTAEIPSPKSPLEKKNLPNNDKQNTISPPSNNNIIKTTEHQCRDFINNQTCQEKATTQLSETNETVVSNPQTNITLSSDVQLEKTSEVSKTNETPVEPPENQAKLSCDPQTETVEKSENTNVNENQTDLKTLELNLPHSELSNDIFASLNVPSACQNPGSTSPTAAFLLAFPLVSSGVKVTEVIDEENSESQRETPQLLQIGTIDNTKTTQSHTDSLTPSFLNMDNFSFLYDKKTGLAKENFDNNSQLVPRESTELPVLNFQETGKNAPVFDNFQQNYRPKETAVHNGNNIGNTEEFKTKSTNNVSIPYITPLTFENKSKSTESSQKVAQNQPFANKNISQQNIVDQNINNYNTTKIVQNDIILPNLEHHTMNYQHKNTNEVAKNSQTLNYQAKFDHGNIVQSNMVYQTKCAEKPIDQHISNYSSKITHEIGPQANITYHKSSNNEQSCNFSSKISHDIPQNYQSKASIETTQKPELIPHNLNQIPQYHRKNSKQMEQQQQHTTYPKNDNNQLNIQHISHVNYSNQQKTDQNNQNNLNLNLLYQNKPKGNEVNQNLNQNYHKKTDITTDMTKQNYCNYEQKVSTTYPSTSKNYNELYINSSSYNYNYSMDTNFNQNYYKNSTKSYYPISYENYPKNDSYMSGNYYSNTQNKFTGSISPKNKNSSHNKPVNWMTTPDNSFKTDYSLTSITKDDFFGTNSFVTTTATTYFNPCGDMTEVKKTLDLQANSCQKEIEDNHFSWSPTRVPQFLDATHNLMSSTLPTLVGDLALNNPPFIDQKKSKRKSSYEAQNNFFSVSQLVEPQSKESVSSQANPKRTGNRNSKTGSSPRSKKKESTKKNGYNLENFCEKLPRKNASSSYSAEALIGNQQQDSKKQPPGKSIVPSFLPENILPYFPTVELQDNSYNQNYQPNTFSHGFPPLPDFTNSHDAIGENLSQNKSRHCSKSQSCPKKTKKKPEEALPNFELPFLPVPVPSVNSPMLPDDLHAHTFLHPGTSYPCKNPLYGKQNAELAPPPPLLARLPVTSGRSAAQEVMPTVSGPSLTNFSVSNIFPEINKGHLPEIYPDPRIKDHSISRNFPSTTTQASTSFHGKPSFSFSTYN